MELSAADRTHLANIMVQSYMHQLLLQGESSVSPGGATDQHGKIPAGGTSGQHGNISLEFRNFLLQNSSFDCDKIMELLAKFGFNELLLQVARVSSINLSFLFVYTMAMHNTIFIWSNW